MKTSFLLGIIMCLCLISCAHFSREDLENTAASIAKRVFSCVISSAGNELRRMDASTDTDASLPTEP